MLRSFILSCLLFFCFSVCYSAVLTGTITHNGNYIADANIHVTNQPIGCKSSSTGVYILSLPNTGQYEIEVSAIGYNTRKLQINLLSNDTLKMNIELYGGAKELNEVVVTGVTRATLLKKSPVPIVVTNKVQLEAKGGSNIIDAITKGIPGVTAVTTGPNISKPFIRGLGYNRVLTMYDGIRQEGQQWGDEHGIEVDQQNIERVEVVKGPASLIYGSDALAGVINMIPTVNEEKKWNGDIGIEAHSNNGLGGLSAGIGKSFNNWQTTIRGSVKTAHDYKNSIEGYVYNTGFREEHLSILTQTSQKWGRLRIGATAYNNLQEIPDGSRDSASRAFTYQIHESNTDTISKRPLVPGNQYKQYSIAALHQHIRHYRAYAQLYIPLPHQQEISGSVAYQYNIRQEYNHPTQPSQPGLDLSLATINYDVKYQLPEIKKWYTTIGCNGMYQQNKSRIATDFPIPDYQLFDIGAFVFSKKSFEQIEVSGGVRFDNRFINWQDQYIGTDSITGFGYKSDKHNGTLQFPSYSHHYTGISGSIGVAYTAKNNWIYKLNIARGYRAPNITEIGSNGLDPGAHIVYLGNRNFKPEFTWQQDIGIIGGIGGINLAVDVFNTFISNYIYQARAFDAQGNPIVLVPGNSTYQYQQAEAHLYGGELQANYAIPCLKGLEINAGAAYVVGLNKNDQLIAKYGEAARYLPLIPPFNARGEIKYNAYRRSTKLKNTYISAGCQYYAMQNRFYGVDNSETPTAAYTLVFATAGTTILHHKKPLCRIALQADNIFNTAYQSHLNRLKYFEYYTHSISGRYGIYNMGANYSIKFTWVI